MALIKCFSCGAETDDIDGATHSYLLSTPGCWAMYGEVLAREYSDFAYWAVHDLTVDTYSIQHPGQPSRQTISSLNVHLSSLYAYFKLDVSAGELSNIKVKVVQHKDQFVWLEPPDCLGHLTINDILRAENATQHCELVNQWAEDVFNQWQDFHPVVQALLETSM
ncbi:hypothetical protein D0962_01510 [Leptolyngbyaceae cyanobacterium CCMR0082]|uniref:Uncharacterized protein n=1 Tax=Adonisia turfae CCMR0082 TaxID=2304604 RepID=A0A6M0RZZ1_9CYAN|nr:DUF5946 family protein [Adonisia turfae]NEZ61463.1 hypothetical protein [Adonisia turfae CCMR0082]